MKFLALTFLLVASASCFPDPAQVILDAAATAVQGLDNGLAFDVQKLIADLKKLEADVQTIIGAIKSGQKDQVKPLLQTLVNDAKQLLKDLGLLRLSDEYEVDLGLIGLDENGALNLDVEKLTKDLTKVMSDVKGLIMAIKEHQTPVQIIMAVSRLGTDLVALLQDIAQANSQQVALEAAEVTGIHDLIDKIKKMIEKISEALKTCAVPNAKAMQKDIDAMKDLIGKIANGTSPFVLIHNLTDAFQKLVGDLQTIAQCFHPDNSLFGLQASADLRDSLIDRIKAIIKKFCDALENCAKPEAKKILEDVEKVKALIDELQRKDNARPFQEVMKELCQELRKVVGEMGTMAECFKQ